MKPHQNQTYLFRARSYIATHGVLLVNTEFIPDLTGLTHIVANNGGAQLNIGGAEALSKRYKTTPMTLPILP